MDTTAEIGSQATGREPESVALELHEDLAIIRLGQPAERAVVLTEARMNSLARALATVRENKNIRGLLLISASPQMFCAGADINVIRAVSDPQVGERLAKMGQRIFDTLEALPCRKVAAISGACVGGGCELVLACDYRLLVNSRDTKIGLPEVKLGILPGFGGTQRLPRLIGLKQALDIILQGKVVPAAKALQLGLADKLIDPPSDGSSIMPILESVGREIALSKTSPRKRKPSVSDLALTYTAIGHSLVQSRARKSIIEKTGGKYPAPLRALDTVIHGLKNGMVAGLEEEARALGELIATKESKALVHVYFLTEASAKLGRSAKVDLERAQLAVLGGGTMGAGIASAFALGGFPVTLVDPQEDARKKALHHIEDCLRKQRALTEIEFQELLKKVRLSATMSELTDVSVVVEAVPENLALKKEVLRGAAKHVGKKCIIASNTSSLSIQELAASIDEPDRVVGMHFFNPAEKMPLVEIVLGKETNERSIAYTAALAVKIGKYPVVVNEVPGFLVNRILTPYLVEAGHALQDGYFIEAIDRAAVQFGMPMGPLRLLDEIGLDIAEHVVDILRKAYGARLVGPGYVTKLVSLGRLGKKSGSGFYLHEGKDHRHDPLVPSLLGLPPTRSEANEEELTSRLMLSMVNEAVRCLDGGVAGAPGPEAAGQIDLATVMGLGFAPFRGGILFYAEALGAQHVYQTLKSLQDKFGERFSPCEGIRLRAEKGKTFYQACD